MEIDIITGRPKEKRDVKRQMDERLEHDISKGLEVEQKLSSEDGKFFVSMVEAMLEDRISYLIDQDDQAKTLVFMLAKLGNEMRAGKQAAIKLSRAVLDPGI